MRDTTERRSPSMVLCLVRHGETLWNRERRYQGQVDVPLSEVGRRQAHAVARRLAAERWDRVYSSDLVRARETAEIIARHCGIPLLTDPRLRERAYGRLEGLTRQEIEVLTGGKGRREQDLEPYGVERWEDLADRSQAVVDEWVSAHPGERLIAVSHGGWIRALLGRLFPDWDPDMPLANTGVTLLHRDQGRWRRILVSDTAHLQV
ncbi:histidine phosphatase family protein [Hydrogenibacillus schlegelii]|uniref:histidine phosphatase family protein n=1 Tax=Hydrogenibacillus schlegelii TaxID=1484 RepID=UPI00235314EC|nr:histidine phosphatase family protein [Hydrogenibacillus schlegelii]